MYGSGRGLLGLVVLCSVTGKLRCADAYEAFRFGLAQLVPALRRRTRVMTPLVIVAEATVPVAPAVPEAVDVGFAPAALPLVSFAALTGMHRACANDDPYPGRRVDGPAVTGRRDTAQLFADHRRGPHTVGAPLIGSWSWRP
ncbi:hypothetical protein ACFYOV_18545 [Streptomyces sp. NPDC005931]|uniref:hypothetical protein n=1 Tax=Streptomyces sp. NPDC005931 TaxID=3364737 RepID=UPI003684C346